MWKVRKVFGLVSDLDIAKTIFFNFKVLPFRQAIKMPIWIGRKYKIFKYSHIRRKGVVIKCPVRCGVLRLNWRIAEYIGYHLSGSMLLEGKMEVNGFCIIGQGSNVYVKKGATLVLGKNVQITGNTRLIVHQSIEIGSDVLISWDVQIYDTDFHYILRDKDKIHRLTLPVRIGSNVWICNNVTVGKGSFIPSDCIVSANSLVNKRYIMSKHGILLAGSPAAIKKENLLPVINAEKERLYDYIFDNDKSKMFVNIE